MNMITVVRTKNDIAIQAIEASVTTGSLDPNNPNKVSTDSLGASLERSTSFTLTQRVLPSVLEWKLRAALIERKQQESTLYSGGSKNSQNELDPFLANLNSLFIDLSASAFFSKSVYLIQ